MGKNSEIEAVLHLPPDGCTPFVLEKRICGFYVAMVEKGLCSMPKPQKLEVLRIIISDIRQ